MNILERERERGGSKHTLLIPGSMTFSLDNSISDIWSGNGESPMYCWIGETVKDIQINGLYRN